MAWLIDFLTRMLEWLKVALLWVPQALTEVVLNSLALVLEAIPVPSFIANLPNALAFISPDIVFFLEGFAIGEGLTIISAALVIRFAIRRLPVVG